MAVKNSLAKPNFESSAIKYDSNGTEVTLSPAIIKKYLVNGQGNVTDQEVVMFLNLCKAQRLNPFLREAYLIKYGSQPATIVTGKEVFTKRARRNKDYAGQQAGIIVQKEDGSIEQRIGTLRLDGEEIVGGWAKIFIKGYDVPIEITVSYWEYVGTKSNGEINSQWAKKPATMIRKVALVQALREAFPEDFQGMYSAEEMNVIEPEADELEVVNAEAVEEEEKEEENDPLS